MLHSGVVESWRSAIEDEGTVREKATFQPSLQTDLKGGIK
jgi:hypothetical protein